MREMSSIMSNIDKHSLVIIDELGRGTSTRDGMAVVLAIAGRLTRSGAFVEFVTHFRDLARIMSERSGVVTKHLSVDTSQDNALTMLYRVEEGVEREGHHGHKLAQVSSFPAEVLSVAKRVAKSLEPQAKRNRPASSAIILARRREPVFEAREQLLHAQAGRMSDEILLGWVQAKRSMSIDDMHIDAETEDGENEYSCEGNGRDTPEVVDQQHQELYPIRASRQESQARSTARSDSEQLFEDWALGVDTMR